MGNHLSDIHCLTCGRYLVDGVWRKPATGPNLVLLDKATTYGFCPECRAEKENSVPVVQRYLNRWVQEILLPQLVGFLLTHSPQYAELKLGELTSWAVKFIEAGALLISPSCYLGLQRREDGLYFVAQTPDGAEYVIKIENPACAESFYGILLDSFLKYVQENIEQ